MRARTSLLRLVSWVDSVSMPRGWCRGGALVGVVELGHRRAERARVAAHLVQRDQALVAVEGGVLDALGHHRRAHLLEADGELQLLVAGDVAREQPAEEGQQLGVDVGAGGGHPLDGIVDVAPVDGASCAWPART